MAPFRPPPQSSIDVHEGLLNAVSQVAQFTSGMRNVPVPPPPPPACPVFLADEECPRSAPPSRSSLRLNGPAKQRGYFPAGNETPTSPTRQRVRSGEGQPCTRWRVGLVRFTSLPG